ncbi:uncharacterized protein LOC124421065 [Lucilia cuprina]|uniref:uncharacterized protein LOC124421065 n=1 Tax=Lucilia cuprina TaxID=7375 RepID=UPI001F05564A|nr:uncharacterized protein LOC124421065 [Lucilia cuprina]
MLIFKSVLVILISFLFKDIKSEELLNQTNVEITTEGIAVETTAPSSTTAYSLVEDKELISLTLGSVATNNQEPPDISSLKKDLNSQIENLSTNSSITEETSSFATTLTPTNEYQDKDTTSSWELIYPEQNSSTLEQFFTTSTTETSITNLPKYFKVDDVVNCQKYFGTCLKQVLSNVVPKLKDGNKYLQIPSLDHFISTLLPFNITVVPLLAT